MNLSKIAAGVVASLCLVSNVALAESNPLTIEDKMKLKFGEIFQKHELDKIDTTNSNNPIEIQGEQLEGFWDSYGYMNATNLLNDWKKLELHLGNDRASKKRQKREDRDYGVYYIFKLLNDEANNNEKKISQNLEGLKIATDTINKVSSEKASIEAVQKNTKDIAENKKVIATNKTNIEANKTKIDANKSSIDKNIKSITEMNAKIELNHKSIQDVKSQLNARLNNLNKDLRRGLATQSALTGLFQPYSVGKMNVTAAVGGYQSEKAIAVGSGYRFNDNFAAKVGLSKSLGGSAVSYNMGVNYEF